MTACVMILGHSSRSLVVRNTFHPACSTRDTDIFLLIGFKLDSMENITSGPLARSDMIVILATGV